jgi:hypothetical protein
VDNVSILRLAFTARWQSLLQLATHLNGPFSRIPPSRPLQIADSTVTATAERITCILLVVQMTVRAMGGLWSVCLSLLCSFAPRETTRSLVHFSSSSVFLGAVMLQSHLFASSTGTVKMDCPVDRHRTPTFGCNRLVRGPSLPDHSLREADVDHYLTVDYVPDLVHVTVWLSSFYGGITTGM